MEINLFLLTVVLTSTVSVVSSGPSFRSDAAQQMEAGFKTFTRQGEERRDFTRIEVTARPLLMVQDPSNIDKNRVTLEIKAGETKFVKNIILKLCILYI